MGRALMVSYLSPLPVEETLDRAESCLGERDYSLVANNCEHFAVWCKVGRHESCQIDKLLGAGGQILSDLRSILTTARRHRRMRAQFSRLVARVDAREGAKTKLLIHDEESKLRELKFELKAQLAQLVRSRDHQRVAAARRYKERARVEREAKRMMATLSPDLPDAAFVLNSINVLLGSV